MNLASGPAEVRNAYMRVSKFRAAGRGCTSGLSGIASDFGVSV
ncbi:hypothetical protein ACPC37_35345 [Streptomyces griseoincarnatus]